MNFKLKPIHLVLGLIAVLLLGNLGMTVREYMTNPTECPEGYNKIGDGSACENAEKKKCALRGNPTLERCYAEGTDAAPVSSTTSTANSNAASKGAATCPAGYAPYGDGSACEDAEKKKCALRGNPTLDRCYPETNESSATSAPATAPASSAPATAPASSEPSTQQPATTTYTTFNEYIIQAGSQKPTAAATAPATQTNLPTEVTKSQILPGNEDLYILKSQIVPPVCPKCPDIRACPSEAKKCPPCAPCGRCPERRITCTDMPSGNSNQPEGRRVGPATANTNNQQPSTADLWPTASAGSNAGSSAGYPLPMLNDFSAF